MGAPASTRPQPRALRREDDVAGSDFRSLSDSDENLYARAKAKYMQRPQLPDSFYVLAALAISMAPFYVVLADLAISMAPFYYVLALAISMAHVLFCLARDVLWTTGPVGFACREKAQLLRTIFPAED